MKTFGIIVLITGAALALLFFGGFIGGSVDVNMTDKGRSAYNQGIEKTQEGLDFLKADGSTDE